ncbi:MAG TPA: IucA/IucC family protein [Micromonosporaceae bacterium]
MTATAAISTDQAPDPQTTLTALTRDRPDLAERYVAELPGARAAVLSRLWGALAREPLPGVASRAVHGGQLAVTLADGRCVLGPAGPALPFAVPPLGLALHVDGVRHDDPAALLTALRLPGVDPVAADRLAAELANSVANLALARAAGPGPTGGRATLPRLADVAGDAARSAALARLEQCVVDGHPLHPCCRTRIGMSPAEVLAYAPEHRRPVDLALLRVPDRCWLGDGPPLLVVHPWQRAHVLDAYPVLRPAGVVLPARPLMSLRTLAPLTGGAHVKTAVNVQMTSAVRTVSPAAIYNGPAVSALLARLCRDLPGLSILRETVAGAVLVDGEPSRSLAHLWREAPRLAAGEVAVPLAALAAPSPSDGRPLAVEAVRWAGTNPVAFFAALARAVLPPALTVLHRGVALEAHGQNTLLVLRAGRPARVLYRDLGGVRISAARLRAHGVDPPPLRGDLPTDDPRELGTKLLAAVGTALGEQVAVLSREFGVPADTLWAQAAAAARDAYAGLPPAAADDARALFDEPLPVKATTAMRLAADPLHDVWAALPNPLAGLR